jgi:hypothetical protein
VALAAILGRTENGLNYSRLLGHLFSVVPEMRSSSTASFSRRASCSCTTSTVCRTLRSLVLPHAIIDAQLARLPDPRRIAAWGWCSSGHHPFRALCHLLTAFDRGNRRAFGGVLELFNSGATTSKCWLRTWDSERYDEEGEQWVVTPYGHWYSLKSSTDTAIEATITFTGGNNLNGRPVCAALSFSKRAGRAPR